MKLGKLADIIGGTVIGDPELEITGVSGIREAAPGQITFISSPRYLRYLKETRASCVIVKEAVADTPLAQVRAENPSLAFARALEQFHPMAKPEPGISAQASVSPAASLGPDVAVMAHTVVEQGAAVGQGTILYPGVYIGAGSRIGCGCVLYPNVTVREGVTIGDRVIIHSGTVIGADGFGFVFDKGIHHKIPQVGGVVIGDDVEIGANSCVDRATIGNTVIGAGTKIDNLVQVGHNVTVGEHSVLVAQVAIGGSADIGKYVTLAGQVGIADHASVDPGTIIAARSGASGHVAKGIYAGTPIIPHRDWLRASVLHGKLPEMARKIRELEERIQSMEQKGSKP